MNYEVSLKERGGMLYAHFYENGKLCRKSLKLKATKPNITYAQKQIIPNLQSRLASGKKLLVDMKVSALFEKIMSRGERTVSTQKVYRIAFNHFVGYFGDKDISSFCVADIDNYIVYLNSILSGASFRPYLAPISLIFNEAIRLDLIYKNLVMYAIRPKVEHKERKVYSTTQVWRLLDTAQGSLKTFLYIAFLTGMRAGEILALNWSDIDFDKKMISISKSRGQYGVGKTKSGKNRRIPMVNTLADYLRPINQESEFVIKYHYASMKLQMRSLCNEVGFFFEGLHNTRHTFASLMLQARENPLLVKEFLGHSDLTMINRIYSHYIEDNTDCVRFSTLLAQVG